MNENRIKTAKADDWDFRQKYLQGEATVISVATSKTVSDPDRDIYQIAYNVAKWNLDKQLDKVLNDAKKAGLRDAERILLDPDGLAIILTRSNKLYFMTEDNSFKEIKS